MSIPIEYSNGSPNFAYNGATFVIPPAEGAYGVVELETRPDHNLYVAAIVIAHGPDCQLGRLFSTIHPGTTIIDDNLVEFPKGGVDYYQGVQLTTGNLRYGTTTSPPATQDAAFVIPSRQLKSPPSDVTIREFHIETFPVPLHIPPGTAGVVQAMEVNTEVRLGIRWFEQHRLVPWPG